RRLPDQVRLDEDHPAHPGQGMGVPGRPGPDRLLGGPAPTRETPAGPGPVTACPQTAWTLPALWRTAAARRYRAATPRRLGTMDHSDQQGDPSPRGDRRRGARVIGLHRIPSHPHALSAPPARRPYRCASTLQPRLTSLRGLLEPVAWKAGTAGS